MLGPHADRDGIAADGNARLNAGPAPVQSEFQRRAFAECCSEHVHLRSAEKARRRSGCADANRGRSASRSARLRPRAGRRSCRPSSSLRPGRASRKSWSSRAGGAARTISLRIFTRSSASRLDSGSSNRNAFGSLTIARPIATRWLCPPESCDGLSLEQMGDLQDVGRARNALGDLRLGNLMANEAEAQILAHAHMRIERVGLEHHRHAARRRQQMIAALAVEQDLASGDVLKARDHSEQSRFSASGGADEDREGAGSSRRGPSRGSTSTDWKLLRTPLSSSSATPATSNGDGCSPARRTRGRASRMTSPSRSPARRRRSRVRGATASRRREMAVRRP